MTHQSAGHSARSTSTQVQRGSPLCLDWISDRDQNTEGYDQTIYRQPPFTNLHLCVRLVRWYTDGQPVSARLHCSVSAAANARVNAALDRVACPVSETALSGKRSFIMPVSSALRICIPDI
jgi:hypothetical protein